MNDESGPLSDRQLDYNLLLFLDSLLEEKNVTRTAKRLGLTQPAVSNALARLRDHFNDPLLVRSAKGMHPTQFAQQIQRPLRVALKQIEETVLFKRTFSPETCETTFRIASTDYAQLVMLPHLSEKLWREAPKIKLHVKPLTSRIPVKDLISGDIDLFLGFFIDSPQELYRQTLIQERFMVGLRKKHPLANKKLTLDRFLKCRHLLVAPWGGESGVVDEALEKLAMKREVGMWVPHFLVAPLIAAETDYIVTLPETILKRFAGPCDLVIKEPPVELERFPATQVWHLRTHHDPAHQWLRSFIAESAKEM